MNKKIYIVIVAALCALLAVSAGFIVRYYAESVKQAKLYDELVEIVEDQSEESEEPMQYSEDKTFLTEYQDLYLENNDLVGWIKIDGTKINYPVMQSKDDPDFYLKHGFDKEYSAYGCPYIQADCDVDSPSDNLIIYGHHMKDGSMFTGLTKYTDKSFWESHKTISFDTLTEKGSDCSRRLGCCCCNYRYLSYCAYCKFCIWDFLFRRRLRHGNDNADSCTGNQSGL